MCVEYIQSVPQCKANRNERVGMAPNPIAQIACPFKFHQIDGSYWKWGQAPFFDLSPLPVVPFGTGDNDGKESK